MNQTSELLQSVFGFDNFRPGQEAIVDAVNAGEDVLAIMPTGGGKSLCFQLPALCRDGVTVVISPLIALMRDQVRALREAGVEADLNVYEGLSHAGYLVALSSPESRQVYLEMTGFMRRHFGNREARQQKGYENE